MTTNAKLALAMAVPAVGLFVGTAMLRGPSAGLGGSRGWCFTLYPGAVVWGPFSSQHKAEQVRAAQLRDQRKPVSASRAGYC